MDEVLLPDVDGMASFSAADVQATLAGALTNVAAWSLDADLIAVGFGDAAGAALACSLDHPGQEM